MLSERELPGATETVGDGTGGGMNCITRDCRVEMEETAWAGDGGTLVFVLPESLTLSVPVDL